MTSSIVDTEYARSFARELSQKHVPDMTFAELQTALLRSHKLITKLADKLDDERHASGNDTNIWDDGEPDRDEPVGAIDREADRYERHHRA